MTSLQNYARFCGPAVVASVLCIDRTEAAYRLARIQAPRGRHGGTTFMTTIGVLLRRPVQSYSRRHVTFEPLTDGDSAPSIVWYVGTRPHRRRVIDPRPTLVRWLREHPKSEAILRVSKHFVHVRNGKIIEANKLIQRRARVTHVIWL